MWTGHVSGPPAGQPPAPTDAGNLGTTNAAATSLATGVPGVAASAKKPFLPAFLSWPIVVTGVPTIIVLLLLIFTAPTAFALGFVPIIFVMPVLLWIDRIEPEPWSSKIHSFLWGAFVAGFISVIVNTTVGVFFGEAASAVASAPIIEETTKTLAIVWMVRRKEIDGPMDGIVYAGWSALGFAVIENMSFFQQALVNEMLVEVFVGRALFTPFAHPLFTMWAGLAIGLAVRKRKSLWTGIWGLFVAMFLHAAWNGSLVLAENGGGFITIIVLLLFVGLFFLSGFGIRSLRQRDQQRYAQLVPFLASRYQLGINRTALLLDYKLRKQARVKIKDKAQLRQFQLEAGALVRLAALFDHDDMPKREDEARLYSQLVAAQSEALET